MSNNGDKGSFLDSLLDECRRSAEAGARRTCDSAQRQIQLEADRAAWRPVDPEARPLVHSAGCPTCGQRVRRKQRPDFHNLRVVKGGKTKK